MFTNLVQSITGVFIIIGSFLPVLGLAISLFLAFISSGRLRFYILLIGPIVTLILCFIFAETIGRNGNLLFAAMIGFYCIFIFLYYPVFFVVYFIKAIKKKRSV